MNKETIDLILIHAIEETTDILGYVPNDNDLYGVALNILEDIQDRIVEYTDFIKGSDK